jgi:hypothetical protein
MSDAWHRPFDHTQIEDQIMLNHHKKLDTTTAMLVLAAAIGGTILLGAGSFSGPASAEVYHPCAPNCTVKTPCELNPDRCKDKGGPL